MTNVTLSEAQHKVLKETGKQPQTAAELFAEYLPSGARGKVISALHNKGLLEKRKDGHYITEAGFVALGADLPAPAEKPTETKQPRTTKQDTMLAMLKEGTTLKALMEATGWQKHSVHGAMANLKKKQNLNVTQSKAEGMDRVYKIA